MKNVALNRVKCPHCIYTCPRFGKRGTLVGRFLLEDHLMDAHYEEATMLYLLIHRETNTRELFSTAYELSIRLWGAHNCAYLAYKGEVQIPMACGGNVADLEALCEGIRPNMSTLDFLEMKARHGPCYVMQPAWRGCIRDHPWYTSGAMPR